MNLIECKHTDDWTVVEFGGKRYSRPDTAVMGFTSIQLRIGFDKWSAMDLDLCEAAVVKFYRKAEPRTWEVIATVGPCGQGIATTPMGSFKFASPFPLRLGTKVKVTVTEVVE